MYTWLCVIEEICMLLYGYNASKLRNGIKGGRCGNKAKYLRTYLGHEVEMQIFLLSAITSFTQRTGSYLKCCGLRQLI